MLDDNFLILVFYIAESDVPFPLHTTHSRLHRYICFLSQPICVLKEEMVHNSAPRVFLIANVRVKEVLPKRHGRKHIATTWIERESSAIASKKVAVSAKYTIIYYCFIFQKLTYVEHFALHEKVSNPEVLGNMKNRIAENWMKEDFKARYTNKILTNILYCNLALLPEL